ncbi:MAG: branched-chain amino acid ABC transporter permease [Candidatus Omnitrophica bacterium]|nr:branched-chain amino acid ABC transporter permease [Candidatus Omnitrophota bacterium]
MEKDRIQRIGRLPNEVERVSHLTSRILLGRFGPLIIAVILLLTLPPFVPMDIRLMMAKFLIFAIFAMGFNLVFGYLGLLSLGHGVYFGAGGYTVALLQYHLHIDSFWIAMPLAILVPVVLAALLGPIVLRSTGMYFLLLTFAIGELFYSISWQARFMSVIGVGGERGVRGIPSVIYPDLNIPGLALDTTSFYYFILVGFVICYILLYRITNSPFGHALVGIREGEPRMQALGFNTWRYKYIALIISAAFSGVAGAMFAWHNTIIDPSHFAVGTSFLPMVMSIIGGSKVLFGPVIGAVIVIFVEYFASIHMRLRWPLILGSIFVVAVMFARAGVGVYLERLWKKVGVRYGNTKS